MYARLSPGRSGPNSLFFAVFPPDPEREVIWRRACQVRNEHRLGGAPLRVDRLHVTLVGLGHFGALPERHLAAARRAADSVAQEPFDVAFNRIWTFSPGADHPATILTGDEGVIGLMRLERALRHALERAGFRHLKPLGEPHVTLLYGDRPAPERVIPPIRWQVDGFSLAWSLFGQTTYVPMGRWQFRRRDAGGHVAVALPAG